MSRRVVAVWVVVIAVVVVVLAQGVAATASDRPALLVVTEWLWLLLPVVSAVVGGLIVTRSRQRTIGWLLLVVVAGFGVEAIVSPIVPIEPPTTLTVGLYLALSAENLSWMAIIFPLIALLAVFPTGRSLTHRWRWVPRLMVAMTTSLAVIALGADRIGPIEGDWTVAVPWGLWPDPLERVPLVETVWTAGLLVITLGALAESVTRYRRAAWRERQQLKLLIAGFAAFAAIYCLLAIENSSPADWEVDDRFGLLLPVAALFVPLAIGAAVLRHRVIDVDLVLRRTVLYAVVSASLLAVFSTSVVVSQTVLTRTLGLSGATPVALSTLLVAMLFDPLRRRTRAVLDRRFFRSQYDVQQVVARFADSMRDQHDVEHLSRAIGATVGVALNPAAVWIYVPDRLSREREHVGQRPRV